MRKVYGLSLMAVLALSFSACKKDDPPLAPNQIAFETRELGIAAASTEAEVKLSLSRAESNPVNVSIELLQSDVVYGTDYTTTPEAVNQLVNVTIPAGRNSASVKVAKKAGVLFTGNESLSLIIKALPATAIAGDVDTVVIKFAEIISDGSQLTLEGKSDASNYSNVVFVDFSSNGSTPVDRKSWNLGFYNGSQFRVILNQAYQSTVQALAKTDINAVGYADTVGVVLDHNIEDPATASMVDYWDGDLQKTAIAEISANDNDNKVYLLSFEGSKQQDQYFKMKVTRSGNGYKLHYAKIGETVIKTLEVSKSNTANFEFASLDKNALVQVEPAKNNWDIMWGYGTSNSGLGSPYWFQDMVLLNNIGGAKAAEVLESQVKFDDFAATHIAAVNFSTARDAIGSKWRQGAGPSGPGTIRRDRFYVVQDANGNVYKLRFISWGGGGDAGVRGRPVIEYKIVKKA